MKGISGGQRRRVSVGIELVKQPQVRALRCAALRYAVWCCAGRCGAVCGRAAAAALNVVATDQCPTSIPRQLVHAWYQLRWQQMVLTVLFYPSVPFLISFPGPVPR